MGRTPKMAHFGTPKLAPFWTPYWDPSGHPQIHGTPYPLQTPLWAIHGYPDPQIHGPRGTPNLDPQNGPILDPK